MMARPFRNGLFSVNDLTGQLEQTGVDVWIMADIHAVFHSEDVFQQVVPALS
jgi:hypothetical protein